VEKEFHLYTMSAFAYMFVLNRQICTCLSGSWHQTFLDKSWG